VYRVLTPTVVNITAALFPDDFLASNRKWLTEESPIIRYGKKGGYLSDSPEDCFKYHILFFYLFFSLLVLLFSLRYLTKLIFELPETVSDLAPAGALLFLPLTFLWGGYFYDFPEYMLMTLCLIFLIKKAWLPYYVFFALAVFNKESNALLVLFFAAFYFGNMPRKNTLRHLALHLIIGGSIILFLRILFASNGGGVIENHLQENIAFWLSPRSYFLFFDPYRLGIAVCPRGGNIFSLFVLTFLLFYRWHAKPAPLKRLLLYTAFFLFPLCLYGGYKDEVRDFSLLFPSLYLLGLHSVFSFLNKKTVPFQPCISKLR
jgi:hypothetical protein